MLLKRRVDEQGNVYLDVLVEQAVGKEWHPSPRVIDRGLVEGWLSIAAGEVRIKTAPDVDDHVFRILAAPGVYCCHCEAKLEAGNEIAQAHVAECAAGEESPDASNPAGYRYDNFMRLERVS